MAIELAAGYRRLKSGFLDAWLQNLVAGAICALTTIVFSLSYAALIFSGPLAPWLAYGIAATFIAAAIGGISMASGSSLPFALASPDASTTAIMAALVASLVGQLIAEGAGDRLLAPTLIVLSLSAALSGLMLCALGLARAGRAVRFVPYPVIGGFLGASGWLITAGAVQVITGYRLSFAAIGNFLDAPTLAKLAAGVGVTAVLMLGRRRFKGPFAQPAQLLLCGGAVYGGLTLFGISLPQAQADVSPAARGDVRATMESRRVVGISLAFAAGAERQFLCGDVRRGRQHPAQRRRT